ncbi:MAG: Maf family protein [Planctomycetaceae bacterium]|jgi:septum formation protein|nr:Maf family protein [Planctomycetaceae bacterium]
MATFKDYHWILASRSPRRRQLLRDAGWEFDVIPASDVAEDTIRPKELPSQYAERLARQKAEDVANAFLSGKKEGIGKDSRPIAVIGCDTIAVCHGEILGKPIDVNDARRMLQMLRGNEHEAISGLCLIDVASGKKKVQHDRTILFMRDVADETLENYLCSRQWEGKAGAFGYQDGNDWLTLVSGSESNVVGLPLELLMKMI